MPANARPVGDINDGKLWLFELRTLSIKKMEHDDYYPTCPTLIPREYELWSTPYKECTIGRVADELQKNKESWEA
jgi:hypothetical protein